MLLVGWMGLSVAIYVRSVVHRAGRLPAHSTMVFGLFAFLAANVPSFVVASQVYGDLFVLLVLGLLFGFMLAIADTAAARSAAGPLPQTSEPASRAQLGMARPAHALPRPGQ